MKLKELKLLNEGKSLVLHVILSTDGDCITKGDGIYDDYQEYVIDISKKINKSNIKTTINKIIKQIKTLTFEQTTAHGSYDKDGKFIAGKEWVPKDMESLQQKLIAKLNILKNKDFEFLRGFSAEEGGNQYFKIEIKD